ncbi:MAG TPA: hypothetical protein PLP29_00615 [Candidatus Ozemobacteraceae bacterium]|nr:hypothetical protein [Candidatus Ozemobacteraceae bacterium]
MKSSNKQRFFLLIALLITLFLTTAASFASLTTDETGDDEQPLAHRSRTITDRDGEVTVSLEWLRRPGEFALTIDYYGYLTQEGPVNLYLSVNGTQREFVTLPAELENRHQRIRILSFHPTRVTEGARGLRSLARDEAVDYLLFRNAPYYPQFGEVEIEMKFFAHDRWDGDANAGNGNYRVSFACPATKKGETPIDHF